MANSGVLTVINSIIAALAFIGNGAVIFVMTVRRKKFGSFTNRLIRHQSVIDFNAAAVFLLLRVVIPHDDWVTQVGQNFLGGFYCRFIHADVFIWGINVASTYNLVLISMERFMATCWPVKHRNACSLYRVRVSMVAAWAIGLLYGLHFALLKHVHNGKCEFVQLETAPQALEATVALLIEYLIPVCLMSFSYVRIFTTLRRKLAGNATVNPRRQRHGIMGKAKKNVVETMLLAGVMFFVCWTPTEVLYTVHIATNGQTPHIMYLAFTGLLTCNMCVNPIIYCFKYEHFRVEIVKLVGSKFRRNRVHTEGELNLVSNYGDPLQQNTVQSSA
ncbi:galanin receptor 2b-like [Asterias amurensis]|uniref:galanin receptor 2b-like n=1 Tax=Asterias amurensis TaxID=7602 RepID=UPI003AB31C0A